VVYSAPTNIGEVIMHIARAAFAAAL